MDIEVWTCVASPCLPFPYTRSLSLKSPFLCTWTHKWIKGITGIQVPPRWVATPLGVPDGGGIGGLSNEEVRLALVNPGRPVGRAW